MQNDILKPRRKRELHNFWLFFGGYSDFIFFTQKIYFKKDKFGAENFFTFSRRLFFY